MSRQIFCPKAKNGRLPNLVEHISMVENGIDANFRQAFERSGSNRRKGGRRGENIRRFSAKAFAGQNAEISSARKSSSERKHTIAESMAKMDENRQKLEELRPLVRIGRMFGFQISASGFRRYFGARMARADWRTRITAHPAD